MTERNLDAERVFAKVARTMLGEDVAAPTVGRFELRERLGAGSTGEVYGAYDPEHDRAVAIKVLHAHRAAEPEAARRLGKESRALQRLQHPNVIRVYDVDTSGDDAFIVMERLAGEPLDAVLRHRGALGLQATAALLNELCGALGAAHDAGIVHRDLKPANIFMRSDGSAAVLDFGLAKLAASGPATVSTASGAILGTPYYMSPEQATDSSKVDHRTDLWAIGVIVYECLTGRRPFESKNIADLAARIVSEDPPAPSSVAAVPPGLDAWVRRALARDPRHRFQNATQMQAAFDAASTAVAGRSLWWVALAVTLVAFALLAAVLAN